MTQTNLTRPQGLTRIDPVLREAAIERGVVEFRAETLSAEREHANRLAAQRAAAADTAGVAIESRSINGPDGRQLGLRLYRGRPDGTSGAPLVLYAHGGGFVTGNLDTGHAECVELARAAGCLLVSVDYRLAPEDPCPAASDDV
jgi:acetyl esterase